ncbi:MAG TPA: hypothetical protein VNI77_00705 [Nitrososphaera sp.]|nr:hypothetical protein [Nitrososphaera sp.]
MAPVIPNPDGRIRNKLRQTVKDNPAEHDTSVTGSIDSNHQYPEKADSAGWMV